MKKFLNHIITDLVVNILTFALVVYLFEGVRFAPYLLTQKEKVRALILAGLILGILNGFLKPLLKFLSFPVIILTLGLFLFLINILLIFLTTIAVPDLVIEGLRNYIYVALVFALINTVEHFYLKFKK